MSGVPVTGVSELVLEVVDLEAAEAFYAGVLGLPVVERWRDREAIWLMAGDRTRIGLWKPQVGLAGGQGGLHVHFAMHIEDADYDSAVALLRDRGAGRRGDRLRRRRPSRLRDRPGWQRGRAVDLGRERAPALMRSARARTRATAVTLVGRRPRRPRHTRATRPCGHRHGRGLVLARRRRTRRGEPADRRGSASSRPPFTVTDAGAPLTAGSGCTQSDVGVTCVRPWMPRLTCSPAIATTR